MNAIKEVEAAIRQFEAVEWASSGFPRNGDDGSSVDIGWVKFGLRASALGWRTLEFLAWLFTHMARAGERVDFFPTAPPPYLNTPGKSLSLVIECHPRNGDHESRFHKLAAFIRTSHEEYWF